MLSTLKNTTLSILFCLLYTAIFSQSSVDSLMQKHQLQFKDYQSQKLTMDERTWIKLVELGKQADALIKTDKLLVDRYLQHELNKNQELAKKSDKLLLEMSAYEKESSIHQMILQEQRYINKILLIGIVAAAILFLIFLIMYINLQKHFRMLKRELEHLWSEKDDPSPAVDKEQLDNLQTRLHQIKQENKSLQSQLSVHKLLKENLQKDLGKEQESREKVEKEIKAMITRLHHNA